MDDGIPGDRVANDGIMVLQRFRVLLQFRITISQNTIGSNSSPSTAL